MPKLFKNPPFAAQELDGKSVEELLLFVGDEDHGFKPEAMERLLAMGLEASYPVYELAVRNDDNADLRNSAMEMLVKFGKAALPKLFRLLRDDNEEVRNFSAVMLGDIGSREAVCHLIQALGDPDVNVRHSAAEALGKIGDRAALFPLIELLKGDFWLQYAAITAIGAMRDYRAVPHLLQLLDNELLAAPVVEALGKIGDPRTLYPLGNILPYVNDSLAGLVARAMVAIYLNLNETLSYKNSVAEYNQPEQLKHVINRKGVEKLRVLLHATAEKETVEAAVTLLGWLGEVEAVDDFYRLLSNDNFMTTVESAVLSLGKPAAPSLAMALSHENDNVKILALRSLRWLGEVQAHAELTKLLDSANATVQLEALESLKESLPAEIPPRIFELCEHGTGELCIKAAAELLGRYPKAKVQDFMNSLTRAGSVEKRLRGALLLGHMKGGESLATIDFLMHDEDRGVRRETAKAIGRQQLSEALPLLREALSDPEDGVKERAVMALAEFGHPVMLEGILGLLGTGGEPLDYAVIRAIGKMKATEGGGALMEYLLNGKVSSHVEHAIIETLGKISYKPASELIGSCYLEHPDPDIRRLAVEALGNLGDPASLKGVEAAAHDSHWSVRIAALQVLGKIGGSREIPILLEAMADHDPMVRKHAVITLGDLRNITTIPELVKQLTDMEMSRHAFEAILKFGRTALPWLHRLMKKDYPLEVRERVVDLIGKIGDRKSVEPLMEILEDPSPTIKLAAIDSLAYCFDSVLLKKLVHIRKNDGNEEVRDRADLALKTFTMEKFF